MNVSLKHSWKCFVITGLGLAMTSLAQETQKTPDLKAEERNLDVVLGMMEGGEPLRLDDLPGDVSIRFIDSARIIEEEQIGFLGLVTEIPTAQLRWQLPLPRATGLVVEFIAEGSPAMQAGLMQGDVLIRLNDQLLTHPQQLAALVAHYGEGEKVILTYFRAGNEQVTETVLGSRENFFGAAAGRELPGHMTPLRSYRLGRSSDMPEEGRNGRELVLKNLLAAEAFQELVGIGSGLQQAVEWVAVRKNSIVLVADHPLEEEARAILKAMDARPGNVQLAKEMLKNVQGEDRVIARVSQDGGDPGLVYLLRRNEQSTLVTVAFVESTPGIDGIHFGLIFAEKAHGEKDKVKISSSTLVLTENEKGEIILKDEAGGTRMTLGLTGSAMPPAGGHQD